MTTSQRQPLVIGVAGGSGSGKTTIVKKIVETIGADRVTVLAHDRYYLDFSALKFEERTGRNFDHPDSLDTALLVEHLTELRAGRPAQVPIYDFTKHVRTKETETVRACAAIIVEGILVLADPALRAQMDIKVYVDTDDDVRFIRRLQRDMSERGRTLPSVIEQYLTTVKPMHLEFVETSKRYADIIVPEGGYNEVAIALLVERVGGVFHRNRG